MTNQTIYEINIPFENLIYIFKEVINKPVLMVRKSHIDENGLYILDRNNSSAINGCLYNLKTQVASAFSKEWQQLITSYYNKGDIYKTCCEKYPFLFKDNDNIKPD